MKNKRKIIVITLVILLITILSIVTYNLSLNKEVIMSNHIDKNKKNNLISVLIETNYGSGEYQESTGNTWPEGYKLNTYLSKCENGSELIYDEENNKVRVKATKTDRCYVYFDAEPELIVAVNNIKRTVGAKGTINCPAATANYNEKYNRIEISQVNDYKLSCTLNYEERANKTYFNDYIIGLNGTTQGTGKLVKEVNPIPSFDDATNMALSDYGAPSQFYASSNTATAGTTVTNAFSFSNGEWVTNSSNMTESSGYYNLNFTFPSSGHYRICFKSTSKSGYIDLYEDPKVFAYLYISPTEKNCYYLGLLSEGDSLRASVSSSYSDMQFSIQKINSGKPSYDYFYEGKEPNNYVWFNNELWRIIGVFNEYTHGISDKYLVKLIRDEAIGGIAWDSDYNGRWNMSSLKKLLNPIEGDSESGTYYNKENGTSSPYCMGYYDLKGNCNYQQIGISDSYRPMIKNTLWHLGGMDSDVMPKPMSVFAYERSSNVLHGESATDWGYIGLMNPSDYAYSVLESSCSRDTRLSSYGTASCAGESWLYTQGYEWTMMSWLSGDYVSGITLTGNIVIEAEPISGHKVRPALYLDENVYLVGGNGSIDNPYIIGM